jgi:hypothetical protein
MVLNNRCLKDKSKDMMNENAPPNDDVRLTMLLDSMLTLTNKVDMLTNTVEQNQASIQTLTKTVKQNQLTNLSNATRHEGISADISFYLLQTLFPLSHFARNKGCVIDSRDDTVLTTIKNGVYTSISVVGDEKRYIAGSVHCALSIRTLSLDIFHHEVGIFARFMEYTFVEVPKSILAKEVVRVFLLGPTDNSFTNPLPGERDVILIEVKEYPADFVNVTAQVEVVQLHDDYSTLVAGLSRGSVVTNQAGLFVKKPGALDNTGTVEFVTQIAEPGDSGTLLHTKSLDGNWEAVAVFRGLIPPIHPQSTRRGVATLIPPVSRFAPLDAVDVFKDYGEATAILCNIGTMVNGVYGSLTCGVQSESGIGPGAVKLVAPGGLCKYGVFVRNKKPIVYTGEMDWATMNGSTVAEEEA